jgi:hypothetical protein
MKIHFSIPGYTRAHITDEWFDEKGFHPFVGGSGIHSAVRTKEKAEGLILKYLRQRVAIDIETLEARHALLRGIQRDLNATSNLSAYLEKS